MGSPRLRDKGACIGYSSAGFVWQARGLPGAAEAEAEAEAAEKGLGFSSGDVIEYSDCGYAFGITGSASLMLRWDGDWDLEHKRVGPGRWSPGSTGLLLALLESQMKVDRQLVGTTLIVISEMLPEGIPEGKPAESPTPSKLLLLEQLEAILDRMLRDPALATPVRMQAASCLVRLAAALPGARSSIRAYGTLYSLQGDMPMDGLMTTLSSAIKLAAKQPAAKPDPVPASEEALSMIATQLRTLVDCVLGASLQGPVSKAEASTMNYGVLCSLLAVARNELGLAAGNLGWYSQVSQRWANAQPSALAAATGSVAVRRDGSLLRLEAERKGSVAETLQASLQQAHHGFYRGAHYWETLVHGLRKGIGASAVAWAPGLDPTSGAVSEGDDRWMIGGRGGPRPMPLQLFDAGVVTEPPPENQIPVSSQDRIGLCLDLDADCLFVYVNGQQACVRRMCEFRRGDVGTLQFFPAAGLVAGGAAIELHADFEAWKPANTFFPQASLSSGGSWTWKRPNSEPHRPNVSLGRFGGWGPYTEGMAGGGAWIASLRESCSALHDHAALRLQGTFAGDAQLTELVNLTGDVLEAMSSVPSSLSGYLQGLVATGLTPGPPPRPAALEDAAHDCGSRLVQHSVTGQAAPAEPSKEILERSSLLALHRALWVERKATLELVGTMLGYLSMTLLQRSARWLRGQLEGLADSGVLPRGPLRDPLLPILIEVQRQLAVAVMQGTAGLEQARQYTRALQALVEEALGRILEEAGRQPERAPDMLRVVQESFLSQCLADWVAALLPEVRGSTLAPAPASERHIDLAHPVKELAVAVMARLDAMLHQLTLAGLRVSSEVYAIKERKTVVRYLPEPQKEGGGALPHAVLECFALASASTQLVVNNCSSHDAQQEGGLVPDQEEGDGAKAPCGPQSDSAGKGAVAAALSEVRALARFLLQLNPVRAPYNKVSETADVDVAGKVYTRSLSGAPPPWRATSFKVSSSSSGVAGTSSGSLSGADPTPSPAGSTHSQLAAGVTELEDDAPVARYSSARAPAGPSAGQRVHRKSEPRSVSIPEDADDRGEVGAVLLRAHSMVSRRDEVKESREGGEDGAREKRKRVMKRSTSERLMQPRFSHRVTSSEARRLRSNMSLLAPFLLRAASAAARGGGLSVLSSSDRVLNQVKNFLISDVIKPHQPAATPESAPTTTDLPKVTGLERSASGASAVEALHSELAAVQAAARSKLGALLGLAELLEGPAGCRTIAQLTLSQLAHEGRSLVADHKGCGTELKAQLQGAMRRVVRSASKHRPVEEPAGPGAEPAGSSPGPAMTDAAAAWEAAVGEKAEDHTSALACLQVHFPAGTVRVTVDFVGPPLHAQGSLLVSREDGTRLLEAAPGRDLEVGAIENVQSGGTLMLRFYSGRTSGFTTHIPPGFQEQFRAVVKAAVLEGALADLERKEHCTWLLEALVMCGARCVSGLGSARNEAARGDAVATLRAKCPQGWQWAVRQGLMERSDKKVAASVSAEGTPVTAPEFLERICLGEAEGAQLWAECTAAYRALRSGDSGMVSHVWGPADHGFLLDMQVVDKMRLIAELCFSDLTGPAGAEGAAPAPALEEARPRAEWWRWMRLLMLGAFVSVSEEEDGERSEEFRGDLLRVLNSVLRHATPISEPQDAVSPSALDISASLSPSAGASVASTPTASSDAVASATPDAGASAAPNASALPPPTPAPSPPPAASLEEKRSDTCMRALTILGATMPDQIAGRWMYSNALQVDCLVSLFTAACTNCVTCPALAAVLTLLGRVLEAAGVQAGDLAVRAMLDNPEAPPVVTEHTKAISEELRASRSPGEAPAGYEAVAMLGSLASGLHLPGRVSPATLTRARCATAALVRLAALEEWQAPAHAFVEDVVAAVAAVETSMAPDAGPPIGSDCRAEPPRSCRAVQYLSAVAAVLGGAAEGLHPGALIRYASNESNDTFLPKLTVLVEGEHGARIEKRAPLKNVELAGTASASVLSAGSRVLTGLIPCIRRSLEVVMRAAGPPEAALHSGPDPEDKDPFRGSNGGGTNKPFKSSSGSAPGRDEDPELYHHAVRFLQMAVTQMHVAPELVVPLLDSAGVVEALLAVASQALAQPRVANLRKFQVLGDDATWQGAMKRYTDCMQCEAAALLDALAESSWDSRDGWPRPKTAEKSRQEEEKKRNSGSTHGDEDPLDPVVKIEAKLDAPKERKTFPWAAHNAVEHITPSKTNTIDGSNWNLAGHTLPSASLSPQNDMDAYKSHGNRASELLLPERTDKADPEVCNRRTPGRALESIPRLNSDPMAVQNLISIYRELGQAFALNIMLQVAANWGLYKDQVESEGDAAAILRAVHRFTQCCAAFTGPASPIPDVTSVLQNVLTPMLHQSWAPEAAFCLVTASMDMLQKGRSVGISTNEPPNLQEQLSTQILGIILLDEATGSTLREVLLTQQNHDALIRYAQLMEGQRRRAALRLLVLFSELVLQRGERSPQPPLNMDSACAALGPMLTNLPPNQFIDPTWQVETSKLLRHLLVIMSMAQCSAHHGSPPAPCTGERAQLQSGEPAPERPELAGSDQLMNRSRSGTLVRERWLLKGAVRFLHIHHEPAPGGFEGVVTVSAEARTPSQLRDEPTETRAEVPGDQPSACHATATWGWAQLAAPLSLTSNFLEVEVLEEVVGAPGLPSLLIGLAEENDGTTHLADPPCLDGAPSPLVRCGSVEVVDLTLEHTNPLFPESGLFSYTWTGLANPFAAEGSTPAVPLFGGSTTPAFGVTQGDKVGLGLMTSFDSDDQFLFFTRNGLLVRLLKLTPEADAMLYPTIAVSSLAGRVAIRRRYCHVGDMLPKSQSPMPRGTTTIPVNQGLVTAAAFAFTRGDPHLPAELGRLAFREPGLKDLEWKDPLGRKAKDASTGSAGYIYIPAVQARTWTLDADAELVALLNTAPGFAVDTQFGARAREAFVTAQFLEALEACLSDVSGDSSAEDLTRFSPEDLMPACPDIEPLDRTPFPSLGSMSVPELQRRARALHHFATLLTALLPKLYLFDVTQCAEGWFRLWVDALPHGTVTGAVRLAASKLLPWRVRHKFVMSLAHHRLKSSTFSDDRPPEIQVDRRADPAGRGMLKQVLDGLQRSGPGLCLSMFKNPRQWWRVSFANEGVVDAGGAFRESLSQLSEELMSPASSLFTPYRFLGMLMAAAMSSENNLALSLSPLIWKLLAGHTVVWADYDAVDAVCFSSHKQIIFEIETGEIDADSFFDYLVADLIEGANLTWQDVPAVIGCRDPLEAFEHIQQACLLRWSRQACLLRWSRKVAVIQQACLLRWSRQAAWHGAAAQAVLDTPRWTGNMDEGGKRLLGVEGVQELERAVCGDPEIPVVELKQMCNIEHGVDWELRDARESYCMISDDAVKIDLDILYHFIILVELSYCNNCWY
eukprot:gene3362-4229_t